MQGILKDASKARRAREAGRKWTGPGADERWEALAGGYCVLRQAASYRGTFTQARLFRRFAARSRALRPSMPLPHKALLAGYGLISDYGCSLSRPLVCALLLTAGFALVYLCMAMASGLVAWPGREAVGLGVLESLAFSMRNFISPAALPGLYPPCETGAASFAQGLVCRAGGAVRLSVLLLSLVQFIAGAGLAALLGLAAWRRRPRSGTG